MSPGINSLFFKKCRIPCLYFLNIFQKLLKISALFTSLHLHRDVKLYNSYTYHLYIVELLFFLSILSRSHERSCWHVRCWYCSLRYNSCCYWNMDVSLPFVPKEKNKISSTCLKVKDNIDVCLRQKAMHISFFLSLQFTADVLKFFLQLNG